MSSGAPTVELLYAGNTAAATALKSSVAASGWDGQLGAAEGERVRLAEGPLWDHTTHTLYFIDILGQKLHALRTDSTEQADQHREWSLPAMPGTVTLTEQAGVLLIAMQDGLYVLDTGTGTCVHTGVDCEPGVVDNRCNDGKADPHGRLVVGTMCLDESDAGRGRGGLYSVDGSGSGQWQCRRLLSNMSIPNGLAWSKDGTRFFHADSPTGHIKEYQYDVSTGDIVGEGKIVVRMAADAGLPDGLTIDDEDMLWVASWSHSTHSHSAARHGGCHAVHSADCCMRCCRVSCRVVLCCVVAGAAVECVVSIR